MAAGYATRLYPLTKNRAKALLPINNIPIANYIIKQINNLSEVNCIYVVSNNRFTKNFFEWQKSIQCESKIKIKIINDGSEEDKNKKGAIGDINFVIEQENINEDVIIIAGDNFFTFDLREFYDFANKTKKDSVCGKEYKNRTKEFLRRFAIALTDKNNKLVDLQEKPEEPKSNLVVYANYIYKRDTLKLIKKYLDEGNIPDAPGFFLQWLYKKKDVYLYKINGECYDIGTPEAYDEVQKKFSSTR